MIREVYGMTMADVVYKKFMGFQNFKEAAAGISRHGDLPSLMREVTTILKDKLGVDLHLGHDNNIRPEDIETDADAILAFIIATSALRNLPPESGEQEPVN